MDNSILFQLFNGELIPSEQGVNESKKYKILTEENTEKLDNFLKKIDENLHEELYEILEKQLELASLENYQMFSNGVKFGVRLMTEVYENV